MEAKACELIGAEALLEDCCEMAASPEDAVLAVCKRFPDVSFSTLGIIRVQKVCA